MDDDLGLTLSLSNRYTLLALVLREQGAYARASALYEECLALHRDLGDPQGMASAWLGLGDIARDQGDAARVRAYCEDCLLVFREYGLKWAIGFSLNNLALAALMAGDMALAARHAEESEAIFRELVAGPGLAEVLVTVGRVRGARGETAAAGRAWSRRSHWPGRRDRAGWWPPPWKGSECWLCGKGRRGTGFISLLRRRRYARLWARPYGQPNGALWRTHWQRRGGPWAARPLRKLGP